MPAENTPRANPAEAVSYRDAKTPSYPTDIAVTPGAAVYTFDEQQLGTVAEVRGEHFRVNTSLRPDYWLSKAIVRCSAPERVDLEFDSQQIGAYKLEAPVAASESPIEDAAVNPYRDPASQAEAHEEMVEGYGHVEGQRRN
jgi:hypothetical protein